MLTLERECAPYVVCCSITPLLVLELDGQCAHLHVHDIVLNLRTELLRNLWAHQRSTEKMRPNVIAMKS